MGSDLETKLYDTCQDILFDSNANDTLIKKCDYIYDRKINLNEKNIFGEERNNKTQEYKQFISDVRDIIDTIFDKIVSDLKNGDEFSTVKNKYKNVLIKLDFVLKDIIYWINDTIMLKHHRQESRDYRSLKTNYDKIENNRVNLNNLKNDMYSLNKMNEIDENKLVKSKYTNSLILMIVLIILLCVLIFILVKY